MTTSNTRMAASPTAFLVRLAAGVALLNLFVAVLAGFSILQSRHQYREQAEITTRNLAQVLENDIAGDFKNVDIALYAVLDEYRRQQSTGKIDENALNAHIERVKARLPDMDALRITDAQGRLTYGSGVERSAKTSLADRPHFIRLREDANAGLVFSQPQISRVNRKWVVVLARRIDQPDGSFGGMVFAAISLEQLARLFATLNVGPGGIVTLRQADMSIVVRHPEPKGTGIGSVVGQQAAPQPLREMVRAGQKSGTYLSHSTVDGIERTFTFRQVGAYPYLVIVGLASSDYLAEWRREAAKLGGMALLFALMTLAGAVQIFRDWKRRRDSVEALARQEAKFRTVADYTYDWEYWQGTQGEILYMTPSCARITGYGQEEFSADPTLLLRIIHPEDRPAMDHHLHNIAREDSALQDFRIVRRDGEIRWISHHCHAIVGTAGEPLGRRVSNRDITQGKQAEIALRQEIAFSETLIDSLPGVFYRLDSQARLVGWNTNLAALIGEDGLEKAQASALNVIHDDDKAATAAKIREGFEKGHAEVEARIILADGTSRDFYFIGKSLVIGEQTYLLGTGVDISTRKAVEAALNEINETLEQRVAAAVHKNMEHERMLIQQSRLAAMGEMIGNIAHQWRQPLNTLALLHANIKDAFEYGELNPETMNQFSEDGQRLIQKMSTTIDDFRDYFKPNREKTTFPLHRAIDQAMKIVGASFQNHNIAIVFPDGPELQVIGYPNEFSQVLLNVLNNAKDAMKERNVRDGKIEILLDQDSEKTYLIIKDNGGGIAPEVLPRIFDPYYTTKDKGTGIGLYMSRMIMEHMDGTIEARNFGDGAEFKISLPRSTPQSKAQA